MGGRRVERWHLQRLLGGAGLGSISCAFQQLDWSGPGRQEADPEQWRVAGLARLERLGRLGRSERLKNALADEHMMGLRHLQLRKAANDFCAQVMVL